MEIKIISPEKLVYSNTNITSISLFTTSGYISVHDSHENLLSKLIPGIAEIQESNGSNCEIIISGGLLIVENSIISILSDSAIYPEEIDTQKTDERLKELESILNASEKLNDYEIAKLESLILFERIKINKVKR